MFFYLSKIFFFFLNPVNWLLIMAASWWLVKNKVVKKRILIAAIIFTVIFTNGALYGSLLMWWQPEAKPQRHSKKYDTAIMLTGISMGNSKKERFFGGGVNDRFIQAARLYHTGTVKHILINGGNGSLGKDEMLEADFLYEEFQAMGIPRSALLLEKQSRNTYESAVAARPILDSLHATNSCLVVTSAMHMRRALASFHKAGINADPHVANFEVLESRISVWSFLPDFSLLGTWKYLLKEMAGMAVYKMTGKA
jgi:uncharacterized SAM-binding protein YcdF (DUF218 family)